MYQYETEGRSPKSESNINKYSSENLLNEIRQIIYSLYQEKEVTLIV